jgi:hypothetical protein
MFNPIIISPAGLPAKMVSCSYELFPLSFCPATGNELTTSIFALMFRQLALGGDMVSSPFYVDVFYSLNVASE